MAPTYRLAVLLALIGIYILCCGDLTVAPYVCLRLFIFYLCGAVSAFYIKGESIGALPPNSTRPVWIVVGVLLMGASPMWQLVLKGHL